MVNIWFDLLESEDINRLNLMCNCWLRSGEEKKEIYFSLYLNSML